jgi:Sec-independent protein secretion pathway component TatC
VEPGRLCALGNDFNPLFCRDQASLEVYFFLAEVATPVPDPIIAPLVVMIPLVLLYEASILVAVRIEAGLLKRPKSQTIHG